MEQTTTKIMVSPPSAGLSHNGYQNSASSTFNENTEISQKRNNNDGNKAGEEKPRDKLMVS